MPTIKEGAIFIADAHYPHHNSKFLEVLEAIRDKKIETSQLFLVGDIFDLLFGYNEYIKYFSKDAISLLQFLSKEIEIFYIEGNHDFCLSRIFPDIKVYNRKVQPVEFELNKESVYISHGDIYDVGFGYDFYSRILKNRIILTLLKPFEKKIIDYYIAKLKAKNICFNFKGFEQKAEKIISKYPPNSLIVEGHFHQGKVFKNYISLPSLVCQKEIGVIENQKLIFKDIKSFID